MQTYLYRIQRKHLLFIWWKENYIKFHFTKPTMTDCNHIWLPYPNLLANPQPKKYRRKSEYTTNMWKIIGIDFYNKLPIKWAKWISFLIFMNAFLIHKINSLYRSRWIENKSSRRKRDRDRPTDSKKPYYYL